MDSESTSNHATVTRISQDGHGVEDDKHSVLPRVKSPRSAMDVTPAEYISAKLLMDNALEATNDWKGQEECARAGREFAAGTVGYISFSESESDNILPIFGVDSASHNPSSWSPRNILPAKSEAANASYVAGTSNDKLDICEDSRDEGERRGVLSARSATQSARKESIVGGFEVVKPGAAAAGGNSKDSCLVPWESQAKVVVDQLERRVNSSVSMRYVVCERGIF